MYISSLVNPAVAAWASNSLPNSAQYASPQNTKEPMTAAENIQDKHQTALQLVNRTLTSKPIATANAALNLPDVFTTANRESQGNGRYDYARASELSFELTTAEGDKVTITASSSEGLSVAQGVHYRDGTSTSFNNSSYSAGESSSWAVVGDLNADEVNAINDLLGRVDDLATQFFSGNLDDAFDQALSLGYDETQIGGYALHLAQVDIQQVTKAYRAFAPAENEASNGSRSLLEQLLPLGNFVRDLLATIDKASNFIEPQQLVRNMSHSLISPNDASAEAAARFNEFLNRLYGLDLAPTPIAEV